MRCHGEGGREGAIAGSARSTGGGHLIRGQMPYPSRASLRAECPLPEIRTSRFDERGQETEPARERSEAPARAERRRPQLTLAAYNRHPSSTVLAGAGQEDRPAGRPVALGSLLSSQLSSSTPERRYSPGRHPGKSGHAKLSSPLVPKAFEASAYRKERPPDALPTTLPTSAYATPRAAQQPSPHDDSAACTPSIPRIGLRSVNNSLAETESASRG